MRRQYFWGLLGSAFRILRALVANPYGWSCQSGSDYAIVGPLPGHRKIHPYPCAAWPPAITVAHRPSVAPMFLRPRTAVCAQARHTRRADGAVCERAKDHRGEDAEDR
jgi:hypothetical protein